MGEYALRLEDREEVKIGTCEDMYYLRYEDRNKVQYGDNWRGCRFRIPFPDEDKVLPGGYEIHNRYLSLHKGNTWYKGIPEMEDPDNFGTLQLKHPCGLLVNVSCTHGFALPEVPGARVFWNGKVGDFIVLSSIKLHVDGRVYPVVRCRFCEEAWRLHWEDIWDYLPDWAQKRFVDYRAQP